jgi:hypothetical protein
MFWRGSGIDLTRKTFVLEGKIGKVEKWDLNKSTNSELCILDVVKNNTQGQI